MDPLDRLIEMAWHASPEDRLRLERTIKLVVRARETVFQAHWREQQAWERLTQAKAASQQRREDGAGHLVELCIMKQDVFR